ncbi:MAG: ATP-binding cassette domain-containing protein [bacterium]
MTNPEKHLWPLARMDEVLEILAQRFGLVTKPVSMPAFSEELANDRAQFGRWLETTASVLELEAEPISTSYSEVENFINRAAPALFYLTVDDHPFLLVLVGCRRRKVAVLGIDRVVYHLAAEEIRTLLCEPHETPLLPEIESLLAEAEVPAQNRSKARQVILRERLSETWIGNCWLVHPPLSQNLAQQARATGLPGRFALFLFSYLVYYTLWILSWWLVGKGALAGRLDPGWLIAWLLLLLTLIPCRALVTRLEGLVSTNLGALIKQKLLFGALQLDPDKIRHQGAGQLFSRVAESEALETLSLNGGFTGLLAIIELFLAILVLAAGPAPFIHTLSLLTWTGFIFLLGWYFLRARERWTSSRLDITHDLVERMVGHRTRIVQEPSARWHEVEDKELESYLERCLNMDRKGIVPMALAARGWMVIGLLGLAPSFIGGQNSPVLLAVGLGGILLAYRALLKLTSSLSLLAGAVIAWKQLAIFFQAAAKSQSTRTFAALLAADGKSQSGREMLVNAKDLYFRYRENGRPVLDGYNLQINHGERLLVQGPSGGGKSTLASILTGLRQPNSGLLLLDGLDWQTLGAEGWRKRIVAAPQFHENHVLAGTFAFNLLMGRRWPASPEDFEEAEALCHELGLGELLQRMPAGLMQMVGETGWQLSHGERSRLYIARALLQGADLIILDESFAALDPENLQMAMQCAINRAATLMVIAHP